MKSMLYINPIHEADEILREKNTFFDPFNAPVLEGAPQITDPEQDMNNIAILSAN